MNKLGSFKTTLFGMILFWVNNMFMVFYDFNIFIIAVYVISIYMILKGATNLEN